MTALLGATKVTRNLEVEANKSEKTLLKILPEHTLKAEIMISNMIFFKGK